MRTTTSSGTATCIVRRCHGWRSGCADAPNKTFMASFCGACSSLDRVWPATGDGVMDLVLGQECLCQEAEMQRVWYGMTLACLAPTIPVLSRGANGKDINVSSL